MTATAVQVHWSSRFAFLMAAIGSAVGLGNIWRFPFVAGENGGGAFILIYVATTALIALPILIAEIMMGRMGGQSPVNSIFNLVRTHNKSRFWVLLGIGATLGAFIVLSYYSVIGGWALNYTLTAIGNGFGGLTGADSEALFGQLISDPAALMMWHTLFMGINIVIVMGGLHKGIERAVVFLMPLLFLLLLFMVAYGIGTDGFGEAWTFLFNPDFSKVTAKTFLVAIGQGFFSVSVALGAMMMYGAYLDKNTSIPQSAIIIALADTAVALLAGLAIFPLVFTFDLAPTAGPGLVFVTVPIAFGEMESGYLLGVAFFVLLSVAAITSAISLLTPAVSWAEEKFGRSRRQTALTIGGLAWALGIASVLSFNDWGEFYPLEVFGLFEGKTIFDTFDFSITSFVQPAVGIMMALFVGWSLSRETVLEALNIRTDQEPALWVRIWLILLRYLVPVAIVGVFLLALWPDLLA
ncbi:MAG: sodium-dependent transporter [Parvibaculaceae bacterium]|nr:sodium-dependent transporter [Parvibaculaceae bacterium]